MLDAQGYKLLGFVTSIDGAKCGYGTTIHILGENEDNNGEEKRVLGGDW